MANLPSRAKRPRTIAAGPYGHPFHPILVTIPIGSWIASFVFDIASRVADDSTGFSRGAVWLIGIGIVGALAAAIFGFLDLSIIPRGTKAFSTALAHMGINLVVVGIFAANFFVRQGAGGDAMEATETLPIVLSGVALALLGVSGSLGGKLAYRYGVRVADEVTQGEGFGAPPPGGRPVRE